MVVVWLVLIYYLTVFCEIYSCQSDNEIPESNLTALLFATDDMEEIEYVTTLNILRRAKINVTSAGEYKHVDNVVTIHYLVFNPEMQLRKAVSKQYVPYDAVITIGGRGCMYIANINTFQVGEFAHIKNIISGNGMFLLPERSLPEINKHRPEKLDCDLMILPGGKAAEYIMESNLAVKTIKKHLKKNRVVGLIGEAPRILKMYKLCYGRKVTCAKELIPEMIKNYMFTAASTTVDGNLITSRSPATAMEFALTIVEKLINRRVADLIAKDLCYNYKSVIS